MENPSTWGKVELLISKTIADFQTSRHDLNYDGAWSGLSLVRMITDALRAEGLLKEES